MRSPEISICIPTFNGESTILETLRSILDQGANLEVLVSDGGSSDGTIRILESIKDERVKVSFSNERISAQENWNRCAALASAPYVKVMGQDDLLLPQALANEIAALDGDDGGSASFVYSKPSLLVDGAIISRERDRCVGPTLQSGDDLVRKIVRSGRNPVGEPVGVTMRTDLFRRCAGYRGSYVIDLDLYVQMLEHGNALRIPGPLCAFRISRGSWSSQLFRVQSLEIRKLHRTIALQGRWKISQLDLFVGGLLARVYPVVRFVVTRLFTKK